MNRKCVGLVGISLVVLSTSQAQDAKIVADNLEFSREFYSGVHFSAIAESKPSFGYQRYPNNGPERIQCDQGTFARKQRGKPWLRSEDWGESGRTVDPQVARKLDGWVKLGIARMTQSRFISCATTNGSHCGRSWTKPIE